MTLPQTDLLATDVESTSLAPRPMPESQHAPSEAALVLTTLQRAVEGGASADGVKALVDAFTTIADRRAKSEFAAAFAEFQRGCPAIPKTSTANITSKTGGAFGYKYAELDQIVEIVNPILHRLGFSYAWTSEMQNGLLVATCTLRHSGGHDISGSFPCPPDAAGAMSKPQQYASALTFARRQSLVAVLGLTTTEPDNDDARQGSFDKVSAEQLATLQALVDEIKPDMPKLWAYLGVTSLAALPASSYGMAVAALETARKRGQK